MRASETRTPATKAPGRYSSTQISISAGSAKLQRGQSRWMSSVNASRNAVRRNERSCRTRTITRNVALPPTRGPIARRARSPFQILPAIHRGLSPSERRPRPISTSRSSAVRTSSTCASAVRSNNTRSARRSLPYCPTVTPSSARSSARTSPPRPGSASATMRVAVLGALRDGGCGLDATGNLRQALGVERRLHLVRRWDRPRWRAG